VEIDVSLTVFDPPSAPVCGNVPVYTENLLSPAALILLDVSSSMQSMMNVSNTEKSPQTPDLKTIVQEIVDRGTWQSGNAMSFIITGTGHRTAVSYEGQTGYAPLLHVTYTEAASPETEQELEIWVAHPDDDAEESDSGTMYLESSDLELVNDGNDQTVGVRFRNVTIPQAATITNAYIEFVMDESHSEATTLTIKGEASDNSPIFAATNNNISDRTTTTAAVTWSITEAWSAPTQQSRIEIGKAVISDLVKDRSVSWGYGTWAFSQYDESEDFTKIHVGTNTNTDAHQLALQNAVTATNSTSGTPFGPSIVAARKYFSGEKRDNDGAGDLFTAADCQPLFLIDVTDGEGYAPYTTVDLVEQYTNALCDIDVTPIAVGFGIDSATQIKKLAEVANTRGSSTDDDGLFALHEEIDGVAQPFFANNKDELLASLATISEKIKGAADIFYGSAAAPTTSVDLGDQIVVAQFNPDGWSGDLVALSKSDSGQWDTELWRASDEIPLTRKIFSIDPTDVNHSSVVDITNDFAVNVPCKSIGDIINSTPIVIGAPPFFYPFDGYKTWKRALTRDPTIYVGANDGALHAFSLDQVTVDGTTKYEAGEEKWAFVPDNLQTKFYNAGSDPQLDQCGTAYCHRYFVDGSPKAGDIFDGTNWRTILVTG
jgi:hypothetical protein